MYEDIITDTANEERIGVSAISLAFEKLGWSLRERTHSYFGIDADVEQKVNGRRTNSHIALQIKSGKSYTRIKKKGKISFEFDDNHFYYWLSSDRPVLLMMYDKETEKIYWEQIRLPLLKFNKSKTKHVIEVPATNELNASSLEKFNSIIETYVPHYEYSITEDDVKFECAEIYLHQYSTGIEGLVNSLAKFREDLKPLFQNPNADRLKIYLELFAKSVKDHTEEDYKNLKKAWYYLAYMVFVIPDEVRGEYDNVIDKYTENLLLQKASWLLNIENFKKLYHKNIPHKVQYVAKRLVAILEQYVSLIDISIEDFLMCKIQNENIINGKTQNEKP